MLIKRTTIVMLACLICGFGTCHADEIASWVMDAGSGTTVTDTVSGWDMSGVNGTNIVWGTDCVTKVAKDGTCLTTNISPDSGLILAAGDGTNNCLFSWEAKIRPTERNSSGSYFLNSDTHWSARINGDGGIAVGFLAETGTQWITPGTGAPLNEWTTIRATYDGRKDVAGREGTGVIQLYINDELISTHNFDVSGSTFSDGARLLWGGNGTVINIGNARSGSGGDFVGDIEYVKLYNNTVIPEPATISLLLLGGSLSLIGRRKK